MPNQQSIELDGGVSVNINRVVNRPFAVWAADVELIGLGIAFSGEYCGRVERFRRSWGVRGTESQVQSGSVTVGIGCEGNLNLSDTY